MKQLTAAIFGGLIWATQSFSAPGAADALMIDDFNQYGTDGYVQSQAWSLWRRFGAATTDGIYSIDQGADGRGARYVVNWTLGNAGYLRYTFPSSKQFVPGATFAIDLSVAPIVRGTKVYMIIADGDAENAGTTTYRTVATQDLADGTYRRHQFEFIEGDVRKLKGTASLAEVLGRLTSVTIAFNNAEGGGQQSILLDNFTVQAPRGR